VNILIVEDDANAMLTLKSTLFDLGYTDFAEADDAASTLSAIKENKPDLILMDIALKGKRSGIDVAIEIKPLEIPIIFITGFDDKATHEKAKMTGPSAYLVKPFSPLTLETAIDNVFRNSERDGQKEESAAEENGVIMKECVFIKNGTVLQKIRFSDILWVQSEGNYSIINTGQRKFALHTSLTKVIKKLPEDIFLRIHKSYIVQTAKIDRVDTNNKELFIENYNIPVGRTYLKTLLAMFNKI